MKMKIIVHSRTTYAIDKVYSHLNARLMIGDESYIVNYSGTMGFKKNHHFGFYVIKPDVSINPNLYRKIEKFISLEPWYKM
jgi:hypothetical protein